MSDIIEIKQKAKVPVAAYCRVSTDKEDQANSIENQRLYFEGYIKSREDWELAGIYADEGVTGTSTKKRTQFNNMMRDAFAGKFKYIVTKEISRFARNTLDSILYTRRLRKIGIGVIFLSDNINTLEQDGELRLTIMASIAQEESRKTSQRVKWGQKRSMEKGVVFGRSLLGYTVEDGKIYVNQEEAEIVRRIFREFVLSRKSAWQIASELKLEGAKTSKYMKTWSHTAVLRILRNEKYCGDLVQGKTITPDYLTHSKIQNPNIEDMTIIAEHHQGIISKDILIF